ncbi:MAG: DNA mismatch repair endonuclease MutH [Sandaracinaceae bacterium]
MTDDAQRLAQAHRFAGWTLAELAADLGLALPASPTRSKGAIGQLVERALGAEAGPRATPDFASGLELKTLPVDARGKPAESTFVTMVSTLDLERPWERSQVRAKLARVLFVPVESRSVRPFPERRFGRAFLWSPSPTEEEVLARDWAELSELVLVHGEIDARRGEALQIRPKARDAADTTRRADAEGAPARVLKRGFYLRARFTEGILSGSGLVRPRR